MSERPAMAKSLSAAVIVVLAATWVPLLAEQGTTGLTGVIRAHDRSPLVGARLLAADPDTGKVHRSEPTKQDGGFTLAGLEPGRYDLAVEVEGSFYLVQQSLDLVDGVHRSVQVVIGRPAAAEQGAPSDEARAGVWNNPFAAAALVLGIAIVVGVLVKNATEDEDASQF